MCEPSPQTPNPKPGDDARRAAIAIVATLRTAGHVAYLAGGCVRDRLLGLTPKDYDVATDATPADVKRLFPRSRAVGEAFGVTLVYTRPPGSSKPDPASSPAPRTATEVATFRTDGRYLDGRRPDAVAFTDARHDAERRDFTVNALFEDPLHPDRFNPDADADGVIDYVGGRADLAARLLRAVGDPAERFHEDHLRTLRAVRFAARLGFGLEPATAAAVRAAAPHLARISRERIGQEVRLMLSHPARAAAVDLLQLLQVDGPTLSEDPNHGPTPTLDALPPDAHYPTALAAWLLDRHTASGSSPSAPAMQTAPADASHAPARPLDPTHLAALLPRVTRWRRALSLSNDDRDALSRALRQLAAAADWPSLGTAARKRLAAAPGFNQALLLLDAPGHADPINRDIHALAHDGVGLDPPPLLTGDDLIALGFPPGKHLGRLLQQTRDAQLDGRLPDRDAAIDWAQQRLPST